MRNIGWHLSLITGLAVITTAHPSSAQEENIGSQKPDGPIAVANPSSAQEENIDSKTPDGPEEAVEENGVGDLTPAEAVQASSGHQGEAPAELDVVLKPPPGDQSVGLTPAEAAQAPPEVRAAEDARRDAERLELENDAMAPVEEEALAPAVLEKAGEESGETDDQGQGLEDQIRDLETRLDEVEAAAEAQRNHAFVKGWLTGVGDVNFTFDKHRFVVGFQMFPIESVGEDGLTSRTYYLGAVPRVSLHFGKLLMEFELPLAFQVFDAQFSDADPNYVGGDGFTGAGTFAGFQWDETSEFAQVISYIQYGHKEDDVYVNLGKVAAATVGHGTLLRRYNPNIDLDHRRVSAQLDKGFEYAGIELYTNDIVNYGMNGVLLYAKPVRYFLPDNLYARSLSIGFSYMFDRLAPYTLVRDPTNSAHVIAGEHYSPQVDESRVASLMGLDTEVKVLKNQHLDIKGYVDYSRLMNTGGDGFSMGSLVRINVGGNTDDSRIHAFRLRGEVGVYHARYAPGYFDMFYEIEKYQALATAQEDVVPKLQFLEAQTGGYRAGGRLEATYQVVNGAGISAAIQGSAGGRDSQFLLHGEIPTGDHLRLLATYVRTNLGEGGPLFSLDNNNALLIGRAKLKILPFLFVNGEVSQMYRLRSASEDEASSRAPLEGDPAVFRNVLRWVLETEIGFEF